MSNGSELERLFAEEYEIQHYEFSSREFITQFCSIIKETIEMVLKDLEGCIAAKLNLDEEKKRTLHSEMNVLLKLYLAKLNEHLENFEKYAHEFFAIPPNVILEGDEIHNSESLSLDEVLKDIEALEKQYLKEKTLLALYNEELQYIKTFDTVEKPLDTIFKQIAKLSDCRNTDIQKLSNYYEKIFERLKSTIGSEKVNLHFHNIWHKEKFLTNSNLESLNAEDVTEANKNQIKYILEMVQN